MVAAFAMAPFALALPTPARFPPLAAFPPMVASPIAIIAVIIAIASIALAIRRPPALRRCSGGQEGKEATRHRRRKKHHGTRHYNLLSVLTRWGVSAAILASAEPAVQVRFRVDIEFLESHDRSNLRRFTEIISPSPRIRSGVEAIVCLMD